MTEMMKTELTGRLLEDRFGYPKVGFDAVLTEDNKLMIFYHDPDVYNGITLDLNGTSALDRMLAEMYRRKMNE